MSPHRPLASRKKKAVKPRGGRNTQGKRLGREPFLWRKQGELDSSTGQGNEKLLIKGEKNQGAGGPGEKKDR